ncbi:MAG: FeoB-associated Cys-rich membrane protein [Lachnospiraceae bacterium]|nr:FeoB-associated Cys-rich membrane protein [Lachnospiraceae bacterium]
MFNYLSQNWGTIVVCFFLACMVAAIIVKFIRDKKHGRSSCCGNCKHCSGACSACRNQGKTNR